MNSKAKHKIDTIKEEVVLEDILESCHAALAEPMPNSQSASRSSQDLTCELCDRPCPKLTVHHLIPKQHTKRKNKRNRQDLGPTIDICSPCHKQIHTLFSNKELAADLHSADLLKSHPSMEKFLKWIVKQDPYKKVRTRR